MEGDSHFFTGRNYILTRRCIVSCSSIIRALNEIGVDAHDLTLFIHKRAARITMVDSCIMCKIFAVAKGLHRAIPGNDPSCDGNICSIGQLRLIPFSSVAVICCAWEAQGVHRCRNILFANLLYQRQCDMAFKRFCRLQNGEVWIFSCSLYTISHGINWLDSISYVSRMAL